MAYPSNAPFIRNLFKWRFTIHFMSKLLMQMNEISHAFKISRRNEMDFLILGN
ncbi:MAG: hypothetical protein Q8P57_02925 [Candidatus Pacearchaeota archaeon]|nr:hypothetical protein [Candidatus Pacearchaeota archaeon]